MNENYILRRRINNLFIGCVVSPVVGLVNLLSVIGIIPRFVWNQEMSLVISGGIFAITLLVGAIGVIALKKLAKY